MKLVDDHFTNQPWWHSCKGKKSMKNWKYICEPSRGFQHFFIRTSISSVGISMSIILISTIIFCELVIINLFPFCVQPAFSIKYFFFNFQQNIPPWSSNSCFLLLFTLFLLFNSLLTLLQFFFAHHLLCFLTFDFYCQLRYSLSNVSAFFFVRN